MKATCPHTARLVGGLYDRLDLRIRRRILSQPGSLAYFLSSYEDAESSGEAQVFERALVRATDPEVRRLIGRHRDDELRHAAMLRRCREDLGLPTMPIPPELQLIELLSRRAGGVLELAMDRDEHVARAYQMLYVVEERAVAQFRRTIPVLRAVGRGDTAAVFESIARDEERHLLYCEAVGTRYSLDAAAFRAGLDELRAIEARAFAEVSRATVVYLMDRGLLRLPRPWGRALRALIRAADAVRLAPRPAVPVQAVARRSA